ncbi:MAG: MltA domain-containing protein [Litorimonas sp.]
MRGSFASLKLTAALLGVMALSACTTVPKAPDPETSNGPVATPDIAPPADSELGTPGRLAIPDPAPILEPLTGTPPDTPPIDPLADPVEDVPSAGLGAAVEPVGREPLLERPDPFADLDGWDEADLMPALKAFQRSCPVLLKRPASRAVQSDDARYGRYRDWATVCRAAKLATNPRPFFESLFVPVTVSADEGLLTGYYETEIEARLTPDATYSEPILRLPESDAVRRLPRARLSADSAEVIAYGKPVDVFFLHVQGSGRLHLPDGRSLRVGYGGNNGHTYKSIGRVLIERGEMVRARSGKRSIEAWMEAAGPDAARELMNQNPRYIFFAEQEVAPDEGPRGAMQVPLTTMGSVAIDPAHRPYGVPVWLDTRLPRSASDSRGVRTGLLVVTQDTGNAIRGAARGDLYFGSGTQAGALAGTMKHPVRWTELVPRTLAERLFGRPAGPVS